MWETTGMKLENITRERRLSQKATDCMITPRHTYEVSSPEKSIEKKRIVVRQAGRREEQEMTAL